MFQDTIPTSTPSALVHALVVSIAPRAALAQRYAFSTEEVSPRIKTAMHNLRASFAPAGTGATPTFSSRCRFLRTARWDGTAPLEHRNFNRLAQSAHGVIAKILAT